MNPDDLIGLVAVVLLFGGGTLFLLAVSPVGKAFAARLSGKKTPAADDETAEELKELRREVEEMRHLPEQLSELGERVDFMERMIAKQREAERLPPAR
jgi:chromosome condensin MukBEF ATPase and DNA-binding subunit MukB